MKNKTDSLKQIIYILLTLLLAYGLQLVAALVSDVLCQLKIQGSKCVGLTTYISYILYIVIFGYIYVHYILRNYPEQNKNSVSGSFSVSVSIGSAIALCICGISLQYMVSGILGYINILKPELLNSYNDMISSSFSAKNGILVIISVGLLAPVGEELLFRGIIFDLCQRLFKKPVYAIILTGLLFGLYHVNPVQICYAIPMGILLAYTAYRGKSIFPAIILHMAVNITSYFIPENLFNQKETTMTVIIVSGLISVCSVILYAVLIKPQGKSSK
jgi:hypothetical protein